ncbi:MAG: restriction endonuclease [Pedobacter sp.]|nr:MAG: restriction endonuclease [Pedobacter sp.]
MEKLDWRKFEVLISEIFRNQGYRTELGKGSGDGGADVRIFSKDGVFDIVTLVQAKRYRKSLPVKLSAVQALSGLVHTSGAEQGIVATTSRFLPGVHQFAARENSRILLADSNIISEWCKQTQDTMHSARSRLLANDRIVSLANSGGVGAEGRVVVSSFGYNSTDYEFFMVIKEDPRAALLLPLPTIRHYSDTPYNTRGTSIPNLTSGLLDSNSPEKIVRVRKVNNPGEPAWFMTDNYSFLLWDGQPCHFDLND